MTALSSGNDETSVDERASSEASPSTLILTIFHRNAPEEKSPWQDSPSRKDFDSGLRNISENMRIPNLGDVWRETFNPSQPAKGVLRTTLNIPRSHNLACPSFRHHSVVTDFEQRYSVELIFDLCPSLAPNGSRPLKLALFDMDSTLINEEVIDELARSIGISDAVSAITARAMNGEIDFATSLKERVGMLKGVPTTVWEDLKKTVTIAEGARELVAGLKAKGVFTGVVSGGFTLMAEWLKGELGLDVAVANHLMESSPTEEFPFPHLSGKLNPDFPIVTPELKKSTLLQLSAERSIPLSETLAVGDGSNDLLMLGAAGLGIAWRAKEKVQLAAPMRLNGKSLAELLYLFGPDESVEEG